MSHLLSRRKLLQLGLGGLILGATPLRGLAAPAAGPGLTPAQALTKLKEGNARYVEGLKTGRRGADRRAETATAQFPYAIILACADSRTAPEVFFDAGIGDLFVVRVAGNMATGNNYGILGSLEYAVGVLKVPLLAVVGHSACGAVDAALKTIKADEELPGSIETLVDAIRPAARRAKGESGDGLENAIRENVILTKERLPKYSSLIADAIKSGSLQLAGGLYDLKTGAVSFI